jgi:ribulose-phosphate 3-epimerase
MQKRIIAPSLLAANFLNLKEQLKQMQGIEDLWLHLDIMDGHFVPNLSFGTPIVQYCNQMNISLDVHLMVENPSDYIENWSKFQNIVNFTFHWEAVTHHHRVLQKAKEHYKSVGIALNPGTPVSSIPDFILEEVDLILIMSVNPGFGGQSFIPGVTQKIRDLDIIRKNNQFNFSIQVDGGVQDKNAKTLLAAGANNLVAGSYVFKHPSGIPAAIDSLKV